MKIRKLIMNLSGVLAGAATGTAVAWKILQKRENMQSAKNTKFVEYFNILDVWMKIKEGNKSLESYFVENNIKVIAIYGIGRLGKHLIEELKETSVEVAYGIDRNYGVVSPIKCYGLEDKWPEVDAIVVTVTFDFENIAAMLQERTTAEIISLDDILYDVV